MDMEGNQFIYHQIPSEVYLSSLELEPTPPNTAGGFGDIYRGRHPKWGVFALKSPRGLGAPGTDGYRVRVFMGLHCRELVASLINPLFQHLLAEAAIWKSASHNNVLRFLGVWEANNTVYLVSPWLDSGTVMQYLGAHPNADRTKFVSAINVSGLELPLIQSISAP